MQKTNIEVEMAGTASNFYLYTPDYKTWFYLELRPEPTITDLSGYPKPSIFNVVHKLPDKTYFICGIKAFKNLPVKAREIMLNRQLKEYDIHLNSTDTTNALMGIPVIGIMDKAALNRLKNLRKHTDIASYYPASPEAARKVFSHVNNANYLGQCSLPPYIMACIHRHRIDGHPYFILDSYEKAVAVWDVDNHILVHTAEKPISLKHVSAFSKWANDRVSDSTLIKEIKI